MTTIEDLKSKSPVFLHNWKNKIDVIADFKNLYITGQEYVAEKSPYSNTEYWTEIKNKMTKALDLHKDDNILFASYGTENWSGDAFVLFQRNNILYEVNGSHCSCYGLEGQWDEEQTTIEALEHRLVNGGLGKDDYSGNEFHDELCKFLNVNCD